MLSASNWKDLMSYIDKDFDGFKKRIEEKKQRIKDLKEFTGMPEMAAQSELIDSVKQLVVNNMTVNSKMILSSAYTMMKDHTLAEEYFSTSKHKSQFYALNILGKLFDRPAFEVPPFPKDKNVDRAIDKFLENTKNAFIRWINSSEKFYDKQVELVKSKSREGYETRRSILFPKDIGFGTNRLAPIYFESMGVIMSRYLPDEASMWKVYISTGEYNKAEEIMDRFLDKLTDGNGVTNTMNKFLEKFVKTNFHISNKQPNVDDIIDFDFYYSEIKRLMKQHNPELKGALTEGTRFE